MGGVLNHPIPQYPAGSLLESAYSKAFLWGSRVPTVVFVRPLAHSLHVLPLLVWQNIKEEHQRLWTVKCRCETFQGCLGHLLVDYPGTVQNIFFHIPRFFLYIFSLFFLLPFFSFFLFLPSLIPILFSGVGFRVRFRIVLKRHPRLDCDMTLMGRVVWTGRSSMVINMRQAFASLFPSPRTPSGCAECRKRMSMPGTGVLHY